MAEKCPSLKELEIRRDLLFDVVKKAMEKGIVQDATIFGRWLGSVGRRILYGC